MLFKKIIGIDFGTFKSRVILPEKGIIFEQPTVVALNKETKKVIHVGDDAEDMLGKTPLDIDIVRPLKNGVLLNYRSAEAFIAHLIGLAVGRVSFARCSVIMGVPTSISSVERRALEEATLNAGARNLLLFPTSYLAALGSDLDISRAFGNMVVDMGGGTTEAAVLSLNGMVCSNSSKYASITINEAIINQLKKLYGMLIGEIMAEKIKIKIAKAIIVDKQEEIEVRGRDVTSGMPKNIKIRSNDVHDAIKPILNQIILSIRGVLEKTPPELSSDIVDSGIVVSGGGAKLKNFNDLLVKALGIPVVFTESPEHTTSFGIQKILDNFDEYSNRARI